MIDDVELLLKELVSHQSIGWSGEWITMTATCRGPVRRTPDLPILDGMTTPPRWLREHRRALRAAAGPQSLAAEVARLVETGRPGLAWKPPVPEDWRMPGDPLSDEEWGAFVAAIEEAKGRPLVG
jgi:hypothetical protein